MTAASGGLDPERDYLQMDPALSYGLVEYLGILEMLRQHGWTARRAVPHGGHQMASANPPKGWKTPG